MLFKMLFGISVIIWHNQQAILGFIFQDLCFKMGQFEPTVAYKSVAYKEKRVVMILEWKRKLAEEARLFLEVEVGRDVEQFSMISHYIWEPWILMEDFQAEFICAIR